MEDQARTRFSYLAWAVLAFTVLVILGGAVVRATGSGDGCGATWPVCGDRIFPANPALETVVEYTHRLTSAAAILGIGAMFLWARRLYDPEDPVRRGANAAAVIIVVESLLGASLVLFGWVDTDSSIARMIVVPLHLINTNLLVGALALTAWWSSGNPAPHHDQAQGTRRRLALGAAGLFVVSAAGALNALADTLYPVEDFITGVRDELAAGAPWLVQVRILHPLLAILIGLAVAYFAVNAGTTRKTGRMGGIVAGLVLIQFAVGVTNLFLATPLETQVIHLAMANAVWIAYLLFGASLLGERVGSRQPIESAP